MQGFGVRSLRAYELPMHPTVYHHHEEIVENGGVPLGEHGLVQVYAFTYVVDFFAKLGFRVVPHEAMPRKTWMDCINCHKFNCCDEVAMVFDLIEGAQPEPFDVSQVNIPIVKIDQYRER